MEESLLDRIFLWLDHFFRAYYYSLLTAVIIALVGFIIGKVLGRVVQRVLHGMEVDNIFKRATQLDITFEHKLGRFTSYLIYAISIIMALNQLNVTTTILQMIIAAVIIIIIIAAALAVKDFVPNAFAGFYIISKKVLEEGQTVRVKGVQGKVIAVTLMETKLQTKSGDLVHVPNSSFTRSELITLHQAKRQKKK